MRKVVLCTDKFETGKINLSTSLVTLSLDTTLAGLPCACFFKGAGFE